MRLTGPDEHFTHQVALPHVMVGSSDPAWRERYWLSLQDTASKNTVLSLGLGQYPNQDVQEAFAVLSHDGRQHNVRLSRSLAPDNDVMRVGPLSVEIIEPFRQLRFVLGENESGIAFDFTWHGTMEPILEGRHFEVSRARATYDAIRYVQLGRASGTMIGAGQEFTLTPDAWWGERDHSWGTRPIPRITGAPPEDRPPWRMMMFFPFQFPDFSVHLYLLESAPGRIVHMSGSISRPYGAESAAEDQDSEVVRIEHDLVWVDHAAAPTLAGGHVVLTMADGRRLEFDITALPGRAHLRGGGYGGWNGWYQGHWKGDDSIESESWDLTDRSQVYRYAKLSSDHLVQVRYGDEVGYGIMEYMVLPGYGRYEQALPPARDSAP
jgi:hypothetical protein